MVIGDFLKRDSQKHRILVVKLYTGDLMDSWHKCGMTSNFIASYTSSSLPNSKKIFNSLSVILNELIENAAKYSNNKTEPIYVHIIAEKNRTEIIVEVVNLINREQYEIIGNIAGDLTDHEKAVFQYFEKIKNQRPGKKESGLGLLMVINYFNAGFSFNIEELKENSLYKNTIQVKLNTEEL